MRLRYTEHARARLDHQIDYLIEQNAVAAAEHLSLRVAGFLENSLRAHPKIGRYISEKHVWETWIPGTKLVVWYAINDDELVIIDFWHTSQKRDTT